MSRIPAKKLRCDSEIEFVGKECDHIPSSKLPTTRQVLCYFFYLNRDSKRTRREASRMCIQEVLFIWSKTKIPVIQEIKCIGKLEKLYEDWRRACKEPKRNVGERKTKKVQDLTCKLDMLFDISRSDAQGIIEQQINSAKSDAVKKGYEEDLKFFLDQRDGPRLGTIGGVDLKLKTKELKDARRKSRTEECESKRLNLDTEGCRFAESDVVAAALGNESDTESDSGSAEPSASSSRSLRRGRKDIITPALCQALDAAKLSPNLASDVLSAAAVAFGVTVQETNINRTSIRRKREKSRAEIVDKQKETLNTTVDRVLQVSWDGKRVEPLEGVGPCLKSDQEREAVLVCGINTDQLLGAPALTAGNAEAITGAISNPMVEWKLTENVRGAVFDTTAVNSGRLNGVAVQLEHFLGRELLWTPCRHHVMERILESVYRELMGATSGPEDQIFKDLLATWPNIDQKKFSTFKDLAITRRHLSGCAADIVQFAKSHMKERQPRADYRELLKLAITYLGGQLDDADSGATFAHPGPVTSARWMSVALYSLRLALFRNQVRLPRSDAEKILQVVIFVVSVYLQAWMTAPLSVSASRNDLDLLKKLVEYKRINKRVSEAATKRLLYHSWYLSEVNLGLSVFDEELSISEREAIVMSMNSKEGAEDPSKKREDIQLQLVPKLSLSDLVTKNTQRFFTVLDLKSEFLNYPVAEWNTRDDYTEGREIVTHLRVVNDMAERGVKLFKDFNRKLTRKEDVFQDLVVSVHDHRKSRPDFKKSTLVTKYDK